jgi:hypothetical protein
LLEKNWGKVNDEEFGFEVSDARVCNRLVRTLRALPHEEAIGKPLGAEKLGGYVEWH